MSWGCCASPAAGGGASGGFCAGGALAAGGRGAALGCAGGGACANAVVQTAIASRAVVSADADSANARAPGRADPDAIRTFMSESFFLPALTASRPGRAGTPLVRLCRHQIRQERDAGPYTPIAPGDKAGRKY